MYPTTNTGAATAGGSTTTTVACATPPNQIDLSLPPGVGPVRISGTGATTATTTRPPAADGDLVASIRADLNATTPSSIILRFTNKGPGRVDGPALAVVVVPQSVKTTNCTKAFGVRVTPTCPRRSQVSQQYGGPIASCKIPWTLNLGFGESVDVPFNIATWGATAPASIIVGGGIFRAEATGATPIDADAANNVTTPVLAAVDSNGIETFAGSNIDGHLQMTVTRTRGYSGVGTGWRPDANGDRFEYAVGVTNIGTQAVRGPLTRTVQLQTNAPSGQRWLNGCNQYNYLGLPGDSPAWVFDSVLRFFGRSHIAPSQRAAEQLHGCTAARRLGLLALLTRKAILAIL